jgi:hypothetical protein
MLTAFLLDEYNIIYQLPVITVLPNILYGRGYLHQIKSRLSYPTNAHILRSARFSAVHVV